MSKWVRLTYHTPYGKERSHTMSGTDPAKSLHTLMERYHIYPEHLLSVTIDGKEIEPEKVKEWLSA